MIVAISLGCVLFGWIAWRARIGKVHEEVAERIGQIESDRPFISIYPTHWRVEWESETNQNLTLPGGSLRGRTIRSGATLTFSRLQINRSVKYSPHWMKWTGTETVFHRIKSIRRSCDHTREEVEGLVREIVRLDHIEHLHVGRTPLTAAELSLIAENVDIDSINAAMIDLQYGDILPGLATCNVQELDLSHTWFSDPATADLPTSLVDLNLERTAVTDAGLDQFVRLTNLEHLNLKRTPTTEAAIETLRAKMPWCTIDWEPLEREAP
ncbi:hypothetical protein C5Y93_16965 [Blastopirellula marina]|uniref:Leucine Rich repeats (2 copies) n=1 Tax=Blastopirellula marina TaxID=124 RepID=A0A2S8GK14_9BACT|nr:hypothetical protein C5Y93_16965 [Blastopirellula marina]